MLANECHHWQNWARILCRHCECIILCANGSNVCGVRRRTEYQLLIAEHTDSTLLRSSAHTLPTLPYTMPYTIYYTILCHSMLFHGIRQMYEKLDSVERKSASNLRSERAIMNARAVAIHCSAGEPLASIGRPTFANIWHNRIIRILNASYRLCIVGV